MGTACPLRWTGSKRHRDVVQADGLQPEKGGQVVWMLGLKPDDGGTGTGTAPPEKRKASPRPPARGQKLPFPTGNLTPRAAPELFKGPLQGGRLGWGDYGGLYSRNVENEKALALSVHPFRASR